MKEIKREDVIDALIDNDINAVQQEENSLYDLFYTGMSGYKSMTDMEIKELYYIYINDGDYEITII